MTILPKTAVCLLCFGLAACTSPTTFVRVAPTPVTERIAISYRSLEVRSVSLPTYAASEQIYGQDADGVLVSTGSVLWGDTPERAITFELSRTLAELTGARSAPEPWPFATRPQAQIDVRFEDLLAGANGVFRATGQYFVSSESGRERSGLFRLNVPYDPAAGADAIAKARSGAIQDLAKLIAKQAL
ncbi:MAG: ABC-type transport auxiliary lipoprotein family protein [Paracoccaceae bacterium]